MAGRPADPETGATTFKEQLANNRQMTSFGVLQALLFTGVASGQVPLALATVGATLFQFFFLAVGESRRSGYRIRNWHRQRGYDEARRARLHRQADLAQARQLRAGIAALTQAAGRPTLPGAAPRIRADIVAGEPVHDLRPYRSLTVTQDWSWRSPGYTLPFTVAAGLTAIADPAAALVVLANALFTGGIWSGIQAVYDALEEHNTDRRADQHASLARAGSRQRADEQIRVLLEQLYSLLQQVLREPTGGWPQLPPAPGQPLAQHVAPEQPAPVMPSFLASQLLVGVTAGSIEAGIVLAFLLLPFANDTHSQQTLLSGAEYTDSTSIFGVLGDRPLLNGPRGLQGLTAAQAFYRVLQELLQVDDAALTDALARIREWVTEVLQNGRGGAGVPGGGGPPAPLPVLSRRIAAADWLYNVARIADAPPGHSFGGRPEQPGDIAEIERSTGNGTARFQKLIAPGYKHNLTVPQAWQTVAAELRQTTSEDETGRLSAHGAYAVVAMRYPNWETLLTYARYYDPADPNVPDEQRGVYYFDPRTGIESRQPPAGEPEAFDVLIYTRDGQPRVLLREDDQADRGPRWRVRPRGEFSTQTMTEAYFLAARGVDPIKSDLLEIASEFPSAGIHAGGLGTVFDETVLELARRGHRVLALVPQQLADRQSARGHVATRWKWTKAEQQERVRPLPAEMVDRVTPLVAGLPEAFAHKADKARDDEAWATAAGDAMTNALYDYIAATGRFPDNVVVHDWVTTQVAHVLGIRYMAHVHAVEAGNTEGDVSDELLQRKFAQETERYQRAAHLFANSPHMRAAIEWLFGIPTSKITIVANGTDLAAQQSAGENPDRAKQLAYDTAAGKENTAERARALDSFERARARTEGLTRFGMYVGRGIEAKGVEDVLEAWPEVKRAFPGVPLVIAGIERHPPQDSADRRVADTMDRLVAQGRLDENDVIFLGFVSPELRNWVAARATFGLVPSRWEPFGVVANEFAAMGKPIVASSWIYFVEHGWNGLLVSPKEPDALARAVRRVLRYADKAREMAALGGIKAQESFYTWSTIARAKDDIYRAVREGRRAGHEQIAPPAQAAIERNHNVFNIFRVYIDQGGDLTLSEGAGTFGNPRSPRVRDGFDDRGSYWDIPLATGATELHVQIHRGDRALNVQGQTDLSVPVKTGRRVFEGGIFYNKIRYSVTDDTLTAVQAQSPPQPLELSELSQSRTPSGFVPSPAAVSDADALPELEKLGPALTGNATAVERVHFAIQASARAAAGLDPDPAIIDAVNARSSVEVAFPVGELAAHFPGTFYSTSSAQLDLRGTLAQSGRTTPDELETDGYHAVSTAQRAIETFYADEANHNAWMVVQITSYDPARDQFSAHPFLARRGENGHVFYFELAPAMKHASRDWLYLPGWGPGLDGVVAVELAAFNAATDGTLEAVDLSNLAELTPIEDISSRRPAPRKRGYRTLFAAPRDGPTFADWLARDATALATVADWGAASEPARARYLRSRDMLETRLEAAQRAVDGYRHAYRQGYRRTPEPQQFRELVELLKARSALIRESWPAGSAMATADPLHPAALQQPAGAAEARAFDVLAVARLVAYLETLPEAGRLRIGPELIQRALAAVPLTRAGVEAAGLTARVVDALLEDPHSVAAYDPQSGTALIWPGMSLLAWGSALLHEDEHGAAIAGPPTPELAWVRELEEQAESREAYRQLTAEQREEAACQRREQLYWQAVLRDGQRHGIAPADLAGLIPAGDAWLPAATPLEIRRNAAAGRAQGRSARTLRAYLRYRGVPVTDHSPTPTAGAPLPNDHGPAWRAALDETLAALLDLHEADRSPSAAEQAGSGRLRGSIGAIRQAWLVVDAELDGLGTVRSHEWVRRSAERAARLFDSYQAGRSPTRLDDEDGTRVREAVLRAVVAFEGLRRQLSPAGGPDLRPGHGDRFLRPPQPITPGSRGAPNGAPRRPSRLVLDKIAATLDRLDAMFAGEPVPLWTRLCRAGQPLAGALTADVTARLGPLRADVARARAETGEQTAAAAAWQSYWLAEAGRRFVGAISRLGETSGDPGVVAAAESLRTDLALLETGTERPPPWSPLDPRAWLRELPRDGIDRLATLVRTFESDPELRGLLSGAAESGGRSLRYLVADLAGQLSRLPGELRDVLDRGHWLAQGELRDIGEMLDTFLQLAGQVDAEMTRLRDAIAALPATAQERALAAWHNAWQAWATPAVHLDAPLLRARLEYGAGNPDEVLFGQAVLAGVVRDADGLHGILADARPRGLPVGEVVREYSRPAEEPQTGPPAPAPRSVPPTMGPLRIVAEQISRHANATAELAAPEQEFFDAARVAEEDRSAALVELERMGDAARWVAEAAGLVADGLVDVDPRQRGARIDIGARELAVREAALLEHVSALEQHLLSMGRAAGVTPERLWTAYPALAWRIDRIAAGCRRLERDLPHLAGVIHRAGDLYWTRVSDAFWVVGATVERIRAVAAHEERHGMIIVADDISAADQAQLAEVLAGRLRAMPDPPLAVVLAPRGSDPDPSWPELVMPNTTLRVHPQFEELGRRVRGHLAGRGGTGPLASPTRRASEWRRAMSELRARSDDLWRQMLADPDFAILGAQGADPGRPGRAAQPADLPDLVAQYLRMHDLMDRHRGPRDDPADPVNTLDPLGEIAMNVSPLVDADGRVDVRDLARMIAAIIRVAADDAELRLLVDRLGEVGSWPPLVVEIAGEERAPEYRDGVATVPVGSVLSVTLTELAARYVHVLTAVGQPHLARVADQLADALRRLPAPPEVLAGEFSRRLAQVASAREAAAAANEIRFLRALVDRAQEGPETAGIAGLLRQRADEEREAAAVRASYQPERVDLPFAEFSRLADGLQAVRPADTMAFRALRERANDLAALADRDAWQADDRRNRPGEREPLHAKIVQQVTSIAAQHDAAHDYVMRYVPEQDPLRPTLAGVDLLNPAFLSHHRAIAGEDRTLHPLDHAVLLAALMTFAPQDVYRRAARLPIRVLDRSDVHAIFESLAATSHSGVFRFADTIYVPSNLTLTQLLTGVVHVLSAARGADHRPGVDDLRRRNVDDLHETLVAELESMSVPHTDAVALALPSGVAGTAPGEGAVSGVDYKRGDRGEFLAPEQHGFPASSQDVQSVTGHVAQVLSSLGDLADDDGTVAEQRSVIAQVATVQAQIQAQAQPATAVVDAYRDAGDPTAEVPQQFRELVDLLHRQSRLVRLHWPQGPGSSVMVTVDPINPLALTKIAMGDAETATFGVLELARAVAYLESVAESDVRLGVSDSERFTMDDTLVGQALTAVALSRRGIDAAGLADRIDEPIIDDPYAVAVLERRSGRAVVLPSVSVAAFCSALVHERQHHALDDLGRVGMTTQERGWVDEQAASRREYLQVRNAQRNHAACVRAEQVFWQAAIRAADNYGVVFPAAPGRVAPTGDSWLAEAQPGEILQGMPSLPSALVSDEAVADADLAAITEQVAALAAPDQDSSGDALARQVRAYLALHQRIEAFCEAHPDRPQVRNFDPLDETALLSTAPRIDRETGRVDMRDLARIIAKVQLVCAAGDDNATSLHNLPATMGAVSGWPALAVRVAEPTRGWSGIDLRPQLDDGVLILPAALDDPPSLLDLSGRYVQGLVEAVLPDIRQVRAQIWSALSDLPAPARVLHHEFSDRIAREQLTLEIAAQAAEVAFLRRVVREAIRTEVDRESADRLAALVRSRLDGLDRVSARRELPDGRNATLQTSYVQRSDMSLALIGLANMLEDEHDGFGLVVQPLITLLDHHAWPGEPQHRSDQIRTTARNLVDLHERALANLARPVTRRARSRWREADALNPAFLMHHRAVPQHDEEHLHPFDEAIVLAAVAKFAPPSIAAMAARVPVIAVSARHLADPELYQALLDSSRGVFRFGDAVYALPNLPITDLVSGLIEVLTSAPASAPTDSEAERALHLEYQRWSNLDTFYDNLVTDLQRSGMSVEDAVALALPPGAEQTHAQSRSSPATLAAALLDRLPAELLGAITPRRAYDLVVRYRTEPAAPAPSEPVAGLPAAHPEPTDPTAHPGAVARQDDRDAARFALREQFVLWRDAQALYDLAARHLEAIGVSRHDAMAFTLPAGQAELYADARTRPSALTSLLLDRLPLRLRDVLTPHEAYRLVVSWINPPAQGRPVANFEARRTARDAVPLALHLQAARWRNYQLVYDGLVSLLGSSGMSDQDAVDFLRPDTGPGTAQTAGSSDALAAVLGELPPGRWPSLSLDEGIELLWPYLEQRAADQPSREQPVAGGGGFVPDDPLGLYRTHPPFPSAWSNSKFFTANTFEGQSLGDNLMAGTTERLTPAQTQALHSYTTGIGYREISSALRDETSAGRPIPDDIRLAVTHIDQAFDAATPLDRDVVVVRAESPSGLGVSQESELPRLIGAAQRNHSYTSTTMGAWPPLWGRDRPVVVRLRLPAGTKALYMGPFSTAQHEVELLLPRGLTTRVIGVQSKFSTSASPEPREVWFVDMEVIGSPPTQQSDERPGDGQQPQSGTP